MRVESPFTALATDPVQRVIDVHARSTRTARRARNCRDIAPAAREADAMQARIIINALRREIDRLMRGIDRNAIRREIPCHVIAVPAARDQSNESGPTESAAPSAASQARKLYAVAPVGQAMSACTLALPAALACGARAATQNSAATGTFIDLIA